MWRILRKKTEMPTADRALPGRPSPDFEIPVMHYVNGNRIQAPFPEGLEQAMFGLGCFWGAERLFWEAPGVYATAVGYAAGLTPNPTYEEVCSGYTGHNEVVMVWFDPKKTSYEALLRLFWEGHDPTQGMRQGNDVGTQYRSGVYTFSAEQKAQARGLARGLPEGARPEGLRHDHDRDRRGAGVLLRRGLSPAVSRQEPRRLLRPGRHRRVVSDRAGRRRRSSHAFRLALISDAERQAERRRPASACSRSRTPCPARRSGGGSRSAVSPCRSRPATSPRPSSG